ncbi:MAG: hypothetical protein E5W70_31585, partial [Mesorhizobium sp.]
MADSGRCPCGCLRESLRPLRSEARKKIGLRRLATWTQRDEREQRTSDAARSLIDVERAARDAKTARLREQRLK